MDDSLTTHLYGDHRDREDLHVGAISGEQIVTLMLSKEVVTANLMCRIVNDDAVVSAFLTALADRIHADNVKAGWWTDLKTGEDLHGKRNIPEMLMLTVSEVAEAMEAHRKRLMDDKLPHRPGLRVELADAVIRIFDLMGSQDNEEHPFGELLVEKRNYNASRADHKPENRIKDGGKAF